MTVIISSKTQEGEGCAYATVEEAAARMGVSASTVFRMLRSGKLPRRRILGRVMVPVEALEVRAAKDRSVGDRS